MILLNESMLWKEKELEIYNVYCTLRAWIMPILCPFLTVQWVGLQSVIIAFLGHTLSFFETIIIVDDNTTVSHKIEW